MDSLSTPHALLCARDPAVIEAVEVTAAALEVPLRVVGDSAEARTAWTAATVRLISTEVAARWPSVAPRDAYLVGRSPEELTRCSAELGLPVLPLPDSTGRLAEVMSTVVHADAPQGRVVAIMNGSGGLGVSTLAVTLSLAAAAGAMSSACVELAPSGGGIDLLVGAETAPGLRWGELAGARGELGDVAGRLPRVGAAGFLGHSREAGGRVPDGAISSVLGSLTRSAALVVLDAGHEAPPVECDHLLLMVGADVRSVAAARMFAEAASLTPSGLVVRNGPGRTLPAEVVARSLGAPCVGRIGQHRALPRLGELGLPPDGRPARRYRRQVEALLKAITHD